MPPAARPAAKMASHSAAVTAGYPWAHARRLRLPTAGADSFGMSPELAAAPRAATAACTRTAIAAGLAAALLLVAQGSAGAESADEAKARADAAAQRVAVLQKQVDAAQDAYHHALDGLAGAISREVSANQNVAAAEKAALAARQQRAAAIRALDQSGGSLGVLES